MKILSTIIILFSLSLFAVNPALASDGGIFEGVSSCMKAGNCSLCGFLSVFVNIGRWVLSVMGGIALVYFIWAGLSFILSFGNSEKVANARKAVFGSIIGVGIILGAWTLVNFIFASFIANSANNVANIWNGQAPWSTVAGMCENLEPTVVVTPTSTGASTIPANSLINAKSEAQIKAILESYGVTTNKLPCKLNQTSDCTNLAGMKPEAVGVLINLAQQIGGKNVLVTGGTENLTGEDKHVEGTKYSHVGGDKFDLRPNAAVEKYILDNVKDYYFRKDGKTRVYIVNDGGIYTEYVKESDHWDVCVGCVRS
ncbi:MAG: pilin [bacterium]